jgi:uncharacterized protein YjeT (DUF2065 family)
MSIEENAILAVFALIGLSFLVFPGGWAKLAKEWYRLKTPPRIGFIRAMGIVWLVIVASFYY